MTQRGVVHLFYHVYKGPIPKTIGILAAVAGTEGVDVTNPTIFVHDNDNISFRQTPDT